MIRLGVVDFDSSHSVEFTKRLNHKLIGQEQWVDGAQVVVGCVLPSAITEPEKVEGYVKTFRDELGLPLVSRPEEMIGKIDGVLIEAVDGSVHLERARPFLAAGIPTFVDKPFTCSVEDARELVRLAARKKTPLFTGSSLRYAPELVNFMNSENVTGKVLGCDVYSPASTHPRNPGLFHYGIHGVEMLYSVMGPGCHSVWCISDPGAESVVGKWKDGRIGTLRGTRAGASSYGFTAFCEKRVAPVAVGTQFIYRELLKKIVEMFKTGRSPVDPEISLEMVAFMEGALHSAKKGGQPYELQV